MQSSHSDFEQRCSSVMLVVSHLLANSLADCRYSFRWYILLMSKKCFSLAFSHHTLAKIDKDVTLLNCYSSNSETNNYIFNSLWYICWATEWDLFNFVDSVKHSPKPETLCDVTSGLFIIWCQNEVINNFTVIGWNFLGTIYGKLLVVAKYSVR